VLSTRFIFIINPVRQTLPEAVLLSLEMREQVMSRASGEGSPADTLIAPSDTGCQHLTSRT
jgi:hypothetical protein